MDPEFECEHSCSTFVPVGLLKYLHTTTALKFFHMVAKVTSENLLITK